MRGLHLGVMVFCLLTCSCASDPISATDKNRLKFTTVAVITPDEVLGIKGSEGNTSTPALGTLAGMSYGYDGGLVVGALACGPYLYGICVMAASFAGAIAGGLGGALYGFSGISEEDSLYIHDEMEHIGRRRDFQQELAKGVSSKLPAGLEATPEMADAQAIATLESIEFVGKKNGTFFIKVNATITLATRELNGQSQEVKRKLEVQSQKAKIDDWFGAGSRTLEDSVNECLEELITGMTSTILKYRAPTLSQL